MLDPQVDQLSLYQWIPGYLYPSPVFVGNAPPATFGTYYVATMNPLRNVIMAMYDSPGYPHKGNQMWKTAAAKQTNLGMTTGGAPTTGIYTGIPSGCTGGGNPYS